MLELDEDGSLYELEAEEALGQDMKARQRKHRYSRQQEQGVLDASALLTENDMEVNKPIDKGHELGERRVGRGAAEAK